LNGECASVSLVKLCKLNKKNMFMNNDSGEEPRDMIVARDDGRIEIYSYLNYN